MNLEGWTCIIARILDNDVKKRCQSLLKTWFQCFMPEVQKPLLTGFRSLEGWIWKGQHLLVPKFWKLRDLLFCPLKICTILGKGQTFEISTSPQLTFQREEFFWYYNLPIQFLNVSFSFNVPRTWRLTVLRLIKWYKNQEIFYEHDKHARHLIWK